MTYLVEPRPPGWDEGMGFHGDHQETADHPSPQPRLLRDNGDMLTKLCLLAGVVGCVVGVIFFLGAAHDASPTLADIADGLCALAAAVGVFIASHLVRD